MVGAGVGIGTGTGILTYPFLSFSPSLSLSSCFVSVLLGDCFLHRMTLAVIP